MKFSLINFKSINKIYLIIIIVGIIFCLYASNLRYIFIKIVYKDTVIAIVDNNEIFGRDISLNGCINKELYFKEEINKSVSSNPSNMFIQKKVIYNGTNKFEQQTDSYYFNNYTSKDVAFSLIRVKSVSYTHLNMVLLDEVSSQFKKIIEEELDVEEAVLNILKNLELYLAE